ncbi:MAG TPA: hypothetical protein DCY79_02040, partial [Planctomycetaceae bacterium]|nr:hypothetical protein [Planctomycetaceae bacterium]
MELELLISNEQRVLPTVQAFVHQTLVQLELATQQADQLEDFVLRAVADAIDHAYPAGEAGSIQVSVSEKSGKLETTVRDFGLPQDVQLLEERLHESGVDRSVLYGVHTPEVADEVHWEAFGREGKALRIVKWLDASHIAETQASADASDETHEVELAPEQEYVIRRMVPD